MERHIELQKVGYDYTTREGVSLLETPPDMQESDIYQSDTWDFMQIFHPKSFRWSNGRQFAQALFLLAGVAKLQEQGIILDTSVLSSPEAMIAIRSRGLPRGHTPRPKNAKLQNRKGRGQVPGVYQFWWEMARDLAEWRYNPDATILEDEDAIADRFRACGVRPYRTSSTSKEELAGLDSSIRYIREHPEARQFSSSQIADLDLAFQIQSATWWQANKEPHVDGGDPHTPHARNCMMEALSKPEQEHSLFDQVVMEYVWAFDRLVAMTPDELAAQPKTARVYRAYTELVDDYNDNDSHKEHKIIAFHRPNSFYEPIAPEIITEGSEMEHIRRLGSLSLGAA